MMYPSASLIWTRTCIFLFKIIVKYQLPAFPIWHLVVSPRKCHRQSRGSARSATVPFDRCRDAALSSVSHGVSSPPRVVVADFVVVRSNTCVFRLRVCVPSPDFSSACHTPGERRLWAENEFHPREGESESPCVRVRFREKSVTQWRVSCFAHIIGRNTRTVLCVPCGGGIVPSVFLEGGS